MAAPPSYHNLFGVLISQTDDFSREIEETMHKTLTVQASFHKTYRGLVAVEEATFADGSTVSDAFQKCQQTYDALLWAGRELATSTAGVNCLSGFCNIMVPELISNPQAPHDDLILAIREFLEDIPSNPSVARDGNDFTTLIDNLRALEAITEPKIAAATELDPNIAATAERLEKAKAQLENGFGVQGKHRHTKRQAAFGNRVFYSCVCSEDTMSYFGLEAQLQDCQEEYDVAIATSQKSSSRRKIWMTQLSNLRKLTQEVATIANSFTFLVGISAAIRKECDLYIKFLESRNGKVSAKKTAYHARLRSNAELYKVLIPVLSRYASTVVIHG
ncbi:hypothetical protein BJ165DRAFT_1583745 [Panaeolus papilionaceus]|nr:hypothetical protein BJ165DRAFT_1583745 [Panaeolus papilionaceus]